MDLTMQVRFLSCIILTACHGFLLTNKTGIPSVGTSAFTDYHYLMLTDALGAQKQLLSQMETFVLQLQNQLKTVNQEVKDLKSGNSAVHQSLAVVELKNETSELRVKTTRLQNSYDILQKKFDTIQNENNVLKHDNAALKSQITDSHNLSIHTKQQLDSLTHSIAASNIQNVTTIQSNVDTLTSQVKSRLHSLEQNYALLSKEIRTVNGTIKEMDQHVALTSCGKNDADYIGGHLIKFPVTKTSIGINNIAEFVKTGQFNCSKSGVYLFSVFVTRVGNGDSQFGMYRNDHPISSVMIEYGAKGNHFSGSGTVVVQISAGDILSANTVSSFRVSGTYSCFTVIKIY
ncbi:Hypothetical predicted protein [Mytilus galloprovincialis]|nr:Hypothetical predicted protein [Mytilus galloprovincialis]